MKDVTLILVMLMLIILSTGSHSCQIQNKLDGIQKAIERTK